jgi:hypothetical protein
MVVLTPTRKLGSFLTDATGRGAEATLSEMFEIFELPLSDSTLAKVVQCREILESLGLSLVPDMTKGELDTIRRVQSSQLRVLTAESAKLEIAGAESNDLELKSSLLYDHKKAASCPGSHVNELRSESVLHSSLKTIAAFLTSGGGVLYIGIEDARNVLGIEYDFRLLGAGKQSEDGWELHLRDLIKGNFKDGDNVNDYIGADFLSLDSMCVSRIEVARRRKLSFLKWKGAHHLYRRQGNRTEEVTIEQIEEFLGLR